jgi:multicomponent K+:H+ antiporter subunit E
MMSRRSVLPHPWLSLVLLLIWLLIMNSFSAGTWLLGLVLAWGIPQLTKVFWPDPPVLHRPLVLLRFALRVLVDIGIANMDVARLVLGPNRNLRPAFIEYPLELTHDFAISMLASTISLTPGTVSSDISIDRRILLIHALDVDDEQVLIETIKQRYERPLMEVFQCSIM